MIILFFKKIAPSLFLKLRVIKLIILNKHSFLWSSGWMKSVEYIKPVDESGKPVPWMNYSFVNFITPRLRSDFKIFEYGSGNSTLYFSKYVDKVYSVEHNIDWFNIMNSILPKNATIIHDKNYMNGHYANASLTVGDKFHLIIVDAVDRANCLFNSINALTDDGVIILDDSHSSRDCGDLESIFHFFKAKGFGFLEFSGFKPFSPDFASTTIFYRQNNCLDI
jgi:hypothetical protein